MKGLPGASGETTNDKVSDAQMFEWWLSHYGYHKVWGERAKVYYDQVQKVKMIRSEKDAMFLEIAQFYDSEMKSNDTTRIKVVYLLACHLLQAEELRLGLHNRKSLHDTHMGDKIWQPFVPSGHGKVAGLNACG